MGVVRPRHPAEPPYSASHRAPGGSSKAQPHVVCVLPKDMQALGGAQVGFVRGVEPRIRGRPVAHYEVSMTGSGSGVTPLTITPGMIASRTLSE